MADVLGRNPSDTLTRDLDGKSTSALSDILYRFGTIAREPDVKLEVRCFYEMKKTRVARKIPILGRREIMVRRQSYDAHGQTWLIKDEARRQTLGMHRHLSSVPVGCVTYYDEQVLGSTRQ